VIGATWVAFTVGEASATAAAVPIWVVKLNVTVVAAAVVLRPRIGLEPAHPVGILTV
jgi:hypothetical protein